MLDAQCSNKTQRVSLLEALDVVALDSAMSTCELVCLVVPIITTDSTGLVLVLCRLLNWLFIGGKLESRQMCM